MAKEILVKPLITEKTERFGEDSGVYGFVVARGANKIEIKKAVESFYNVSVKSVKTSILPGKLKTRSTKKGVSKGYKPAIKKAYVTLTAGESINFYGDN